MSGPLGVQGLLSPLLARVALSGVFGGVGLRGVPASVTGRVSRLSLTPSPQGTSPQGLRQTPLPLHNVSVSYLQREAGGREPRERSPGLAAKPAGLGSGICCGTSGTREGLLRKEAQQCLGLLGGHVAARPCGLRSHGSVVASECTLMGQGGQSSASVSRSLIDGPPGFSSLVVEAGAHTFPLQTRTACVWLPCMSW